MITRIIHILCLAVVLSLSAAQAQDADSLRATIESHYTAINGEEAEVRDPKDVEIIRSQHLPDYTLFPWHGGLLRESGWRDAARKMGAKVEFQTQANLYMTSFRTQIYGNVAVATFYLVGTVGGKAATNRVSAVWVYENGTWREAHHHESPLIVPGAIKWFVGSN